MKEETISTYANEPMVINTQSIQEAVNILKVQQPAPTLTEIAYNGEWIHDFFKKEFEEFSNKAINCISLIYGLPLVVDEELPLGTIEVRDSAGNKQRVFYRD